MPFKDTNFSNANLDGTLLKGVDLSTAKNLRWEQIIKADYDDTTILPPYLEEYRRLEKAKAAAQLSAADTDGTNQPS
jgi:uncharacterized protein YjbI with pentapeptide repeats